MVIGLNFTKNNIFKYILFDDVLSEIKIFDIDSCLT